MTASDVDNPYGLGAHALETVLKNENPFEAFMILFMAIVLGYFVIQFFRNKAVAKSMPSPSKNCAECQFDRAASNAIQDLNAKISRDHDDFQIRQKHITDEQSRIVDELGRINRKLSDLVKKE